MRCQTCGHIVQPLRPSKATNWLRADLLLALRSKFPVQDLTRVLKLMQQGVAAAAVPDTGVFTQ
jgi:hypothetical protein